MSLSGTILDSLHVKYIPELKIGVPNLKEQKKIGNILRSLDDKIKLNDSITSALEKLQETLFKRWFIDFEFPDDGGNPYKSNNGEMKKHSLEKYQKIGVSGI